jgi:rhomboid protease GluP
MELSSPEETTRSWTVVRATWLTQKPHRLASLIAAWSLFFMIVGSALYWRDGLHASQWMIATAEAVFQKHEYWRLWTSLFAHADIGHLASNSLLFFVLGYFLYGYFGLLVFPTLAIAFGGLSNALTLLTYEPSVGILGMSGVVYWMGGFWLVLYLFLDKQRTYFQRTLRVGGVALGIFMPTSAFEPQISYKAHLFGFVIGVVSGAIYYFFRRDKFKTALIEETLTETVESPQSGPATLEVQTQTDSSIERI